MKRYLSIFATVLPLLVGAGCVKKQDDSATTAGQGDSATNAADENIILIGEVGSLTGGQATFGQSNHKGMELAVDEINAAGGIKGKQVKVITLDDQGKPDEAATAVTKLITQNKVKAIVGEVASSISLAMAPIAQQYKIPMVTPSSTNPKVTQQGDFIFRVCFIDPFQGKVMATFARDNLKVSKVAVLRDVKNDYSVGLADFFTQTFKEKGGTILIDQSYSAGDMDFKAQLTAIRSKNPEAIFVPGYYTEVGLIARQARELGIKAPLLGGDGWDSDKLTQIGGRAIAGSFFSNHYSNEDQSPLVQDFIKRFRAKHQSDPDGLSSMGYDAMKVLADAMTRAKSLDGQDVRDALAVTKDFKGVTGNITIDENRNPVKPAVVLEVTEAGYKYRTTIAP